MHASFRECIGNFSSPGEVVKRAINVAGENVAELSGRGKIKWLIDILS